MSIVILSPLTGWVAGLEEAPDAAFAGRALGDGIAIDPTDGRLCAPCDGEVIMVAADRHAVAIRSEAGADLLMHVGVDSVSLKGEGFAVHVAVGQAVRAGDRLLDFDLDRVARGARSLISPVLVTNAFEIVDRAHGRIEAGDRLFGLRPPVPVPASDAVNAATRPAATSIRFVTGLAEGVHARPAARIVIAARASGAEITVGAHGRTAPADSALGLMGLGIAFRDSVTLSAEGSGACEALLAVKSAFDPFADEPPLAPAVASPEPNGVLLGVRGAPGLVMGAAFHLVTPQIEPPAQGRGVDAEGAALDGALATAAHDLSVEAEQASGPRADILQAHAVLLDDAVLRGPAREAIGAGASAGAAWRAAIGRQADQFARSQDFRLRERRADLLDLERRVLAKLYGAPPASTSPPLGAVALVAEELLPSDLSSLVQAGVLGVAMAGGGATSHVAIMAAALGLPLLAAVRGLQDVPNGTLVILDADGGRLNPAPDAAAMAEVEIRRARRAGRRLAASNASAAPGVTADGQPIAVFANLGGAEDAQRAVTAGADGCGLLRSEFLFQDRTDAPGEDEQLAAYQAVADRLDGRPLIIRTLDIGSDKPAPYLALPPEPNPALGLRGVRVGLQRPDLLRTQLRAVLRVRGDVSILIPMAVSRHEIATVRRRLETEAEALGMPPPPLGVMIETPAAALTVASLAQEASFFSLGVNDLAQYVLAMDRTLPALAAELDGLHPAVMALMRLATRTAVDLGRKVSVCGGLAAEPAAIPLLIGLGVTALSMPPDAIAEAKALIRSLSAAECRAFAEGVDPGLDAAALRRAVAERWPQTGDAA